MSRQLSLYLLLATVLLIGILFYQVIQPFIISLLFALVLAVLFRPPYLWLVDHMKGHRRLAAAVTTSFIMLLVLLPMGGALVLSGAQLAQVASDVADLAKDDTSGEESELEQNLEELEKSKLAKKINSYYLDLPGERRRQVDKLITQARDGFVNRVIGKTADFAGDLVNFTIGFFVTGLALYYFLADGRMFIHQLESFLPLQPEERELLFEQFGKVCRGVIFGTVLAALAQALLAGIGFYFAGVANIFLLMAITMFFAFIPFVGGSSIVLLIAAWLALDGSYLTAGLLATYCLLIISTSDNLIRAFIIGTEAKMNPLIAFITVIGAIQLIGMVGIFVGPMIAALFYTLLKVLRERIVHEEITPTAT